MKQKLNKLLSTKITFSQVLITVLYTTLILISNILAVKMIQLPFKFLGNGGVDYITCAVLIYPLTIILSDIFTEVFHYKYSRITCYIAFIMNLIMVGCFSLMTIMPTKFPLGDFETTLLGTWNTSLASFIAFIIGDFMNDFVFAKMKGKNKTTKGYSLRAVISTICGQILDSSIFFILGFGILSRLFNVGIKMPWGEIFWMILLQLVVKVLYEIILLPITKPLVNKLNVFETKNKDTNISFYDEEEIDYIKPNNIPNKIQLITLQNNEIIEDENKQFKNKHKLK